MAALFSMLFSFPTALYSVLMVLCLLYWLLVIIGFADFDLDVDVDVDGSLGSAAGLLSALGLKGVPLPIVFTLLVFWAWVITSLVSLNLLAGFDDALRYPLGLAVLVGALLGSIALTRLSVHPLRRLFVQQGHALSNRELVGRICVVSSTAVDDTWGEARVADRGTELVLRVYSNKAPLSKGDTALIVDYDNARDRYLITAHTIDMSVL